MSVVSADDQHWRFKARKTILNVVVETEFMVYAGCLLPDPFGL
jgi:hypothetical protein